MGCTVITLYLILSPFFGSIPVFLAAIARRFGQAISLGANITERPTGCRRSTVPPIRKMSGRAAFRFPSSDSRFPPLQMIYVLVVYVLLRPSNDYINSYRYLSARAGDDSILGRLVNILGQKYE